MTGPNFCAICRADGRPGALAVAGRAAVLGCRRGRATALLLSRGRAAALRRRGGRPAARLLRRALPAALLLLVAGVPAAHAGVFKCLRDDGGVFYQEAPCPPGRELRDFSRDPANVSVVPFAVPSPAPGARKATKPSRAAADKPAHAASAERRARKPAPPRGDPAQRRFLRPGMTEAEVMARVGPPDMTAAHGRKSRRWTYMPVPEDRDTITNVIVENGVVAEVERKVIRK
jgi:hypothetical protein